MTDDEVAETLPKIMWIAGGRRRQGGRRGSRRGPHRGDPRGGEPRRRPGLAHLAPKALILPLMAQPPSLAEARAGRRSGPGGPRDPARAGRTASTNLGPRRRRRAPHGQRGPMPQLVSELDLPSLDTDRAGAPRGRRPPLRRPGPSTGWPGPRSASCSRTTPTSRGRLLRDRRFHSALSLLPQMAGIEARTFMHNPPAFDPGHGREPNTPGCGGWWPRLSPRADDRGSGPSCARWSPVWSTRGRGPALRVRLRHMRSLSHSHHLRPAGCAQGGLETLLADGPPTSSGSSTRTWPPISRPSSGRRGARVLRARHDRRAPARPPRRSSVHPHRHRGVGGPSSSVRAGDAGGAVLMAGTDTTRNQLACSVALLSEHPDQWALLAERPSSPPGPWRSRCVTWGPSAARSAWPHRTSSTATSFSQPGRSSPWPLAVANMDPDVFVTPDTFDITREHGRPPDDLRPRASISAWERLWPAPSCRRLSPSWPVACPDLGHDGPVQWKPSTLRHTREPARLPAHASDRRSTPAHGPAAGSHPSFARPRRPACAAPRRPWRARGRRSRPP